MTTAPMTKTEIDRAHAWIVGSDTGASSKALWAVMMGQIPSRSSHPSDGSDLGRCLRLLEALPVWRPRLPEMASVSPYWAALVEHWEELARLAAGADDQKTYDAMKAILDPIETKDPSVVRLGKGISLRFSK